jgi:hypothetical protein
MMLAKVICVQLVSMLGYDFLFQGTYVCAVLDFHGFLAYSLSHPHVDVFCFVDRCRYYLVQEPSRVLSLQRNAKL